MGINKYLQNQLQASVSIAPLVVFRIVFGALMLFSTLRFWYLGWIEDHYIQSKVQFKYFGFEWVQLLPPNAMYLLHIVMIISALGIMLGAWYRWSAVLFFLAFTYTELIDLTYYLNHYYFVSLVAFLMIFVPAHRSFSVDSRRDPSLKSATVPYWTIFIFQFQLAIVYTYAGLAKINYTWLVEAMPLRIWLPANDQQPLIGPLMTWKYMPWIFSWAGMLYDCTIVFGLAWARTRAWAYATVIVFHVMTGMLFQIGVFPLVMIGCTTIFFSPAFHTILLQKMRLLPLFSSRTTLPLEKTAAPTPNWQLKKSNMRAAFFIAFFIVQLLFPFRAYLYPGNFYWTEQGYRYSWRVMLMEKAGTATFFIKDGVTGRETVVNNGDFLCAHQEKQMSMQPDMILQFAHFLKKHYESMRVSVGSIRAEVFVTLNAQPSRLLIDPQIDLTQIQDSWAHKNWILD